MRKGFRVKNFNSAKQKIRLRVILLVLACVLLCLEIQFLTENRTLRQNSDELLTQEPVLADELAGYLQVIPFSPEETRAWLLPEMGIYLTGSDVDYILDILGIPSFGDTLQAKIPYSYNETITRMKWCLIYEEILEYLGLTEEVQVITIQYLGILANEERLMADNGDYNCDLAGIEFEYGECYEVYIYGNTILGIHVEESETMIGLSEVEQEETLNTQSVEISVPKSVRVLLTQDNNDSIYRESVRLKGSTALCISDGGENEFSCEIDANTAVNCMDLMAEWDTTELIVEAEDDGKLCVTNIEGSAVSSWFTGAFHIYKNTSGTWLVNEVDLEDYLCGVVPGEMPESFEEEALKAQAICARTYACYLTSENRYEEFHADLTDSTDCQVYLPSKENEKTSQAVVNTAGEVLGYDGYLANIYYFSTSCGYTSATDIWQMHEIAYLQGISLLTDDIVGDGTDFDVFLRDTEVEAYDSESKFFRWQAEVDIQAAQDSVKEMAESELKNGSDKISVTNLEGDVLNNTESLGNYVRISIAERSSTGTVTDLRIEFTNGCIDIYHEYMIRKILGAAMILLKDKNGSPVYTLDMLPSAAISVDCTEDGICTIYGGGLGHGIGMSQYGANGMAKAGLTYTEILECFFSGTEVVSMESNES